MSEYEQKLLLQLYDTLKVAIIKSWNFAIKEHIGEHFYGYVLYTSPLLGYVVPSFNTEESLARISTDKSHHHYLRWCPDEWEYYLENKNFFDPIDNIMRELDRETNYQCSEAHNRRWNVLMQVLLELDREGLFGIKEERNKLTVNIMWGDQDWIAHINSARQLNPSESYLRYIQDELLLQRQLLIEVESSDSIYKEKQYIEIQKSIDILLSKII